MAVGRILTSAVIDGWWSGWEVDIGVEVLQVGFELEAGEFKAAAVWVLAGAVGLQYPESGFVAAEGFEALVTAVEQDVFL